MKNKRKIIIPLLLAIFIVIMAGILKDRIGKAGGEAVTVSVESGESFSSVADEMKEAGVIKYKFLFKRYAIGAGADVNLKAGSHTMYKNMGYKKAVHELKSYGTSDNTVKLTIPEGYELSDIAKAVGELFGVSEEEFFRACKKDYGKEYIKAIPNRETKLEGYLFPDTYEFYKDASAEDIVIKMLTGFENAWTDNFEARRKELSMSLDEVIILASVIEREAGNASEMGKVSSVFHNRLKIGMPLQSCATVQYILPERKDVLSVSDTKIDSPYNTYLYPGLPEGPIANPGRAAIEAALYPEETDYYYFKVTDDAVTVFSKTLTEHNGK